MFEEPEASAIILVRSIGLSRQGPKVVMSNKCSLNFISFVGSSSSTTPIGSGTYCEHKKSVRVSQISYTSFREAVEVDP